MLYIPHNTNGPWFLMGDLNNVLQTRDKIGGTPVHKVEYRDIVNMMEKIDLFEKESNGDHFTWSNKQSNSTIYSKIDSVLGNLSWKQ